MSTEIAQQQPQLTNAFAAESKAKFELAQRQAKAFASSTLVPGEYRGNLANVLIATELAERIGCSIFAIMQNVDIIHGRPSMRSKFLIATVNACGRFTPLRFRWEGEKGTESFGCRAVATDRESGEECVGALIDWRMVNAEGWSKKKGSKWMTMPEQMFMYRAAAFWQRIYAPELSLGMGTVDEAQDITGGYIDVEQPRGTSQLAARVTQLQAEPEPEVEPDHDAPPPREPTPEPIPVEHDPATGEVYGGK